MTPKLTVEMQEALSQSRGHPIDAEDASGATYVIVRKDVYEDATGSRVQTLIKEGIDSGPGVPADEAFARLRAHARQLNSAA